MNQNTLLFFREAVIAILNETPTRITGTHTVLDTMEQIQEFYKISHDAILVLIESSLNKDNSSSTPELLAELDRLVNQYFGLDKDIDMTDSIYDN